MSLLARSDRKRRNRRCHLRPRIVRLHDRRSPSSFLIPERSGDSIDARSIRRFARTEIRKGNRIREIGGGRSVGIEGAVEAERESRWRSGVGEEGASKGFGGKRCAKGEIVIFCNQAIRSISQKTVPRENREAS